MCRSGSLSRLRRFGRNSAHGAIQINSCLLCLALILIFCPPTVCGNIAPLPLNDGTSERVDPTSCTRKGCWNHGRCEMRDGKKDSLRCFMKIDICAARRDCGFTDSVQFLGPLFGQDKDAAYGVCHALILPSLSEGLPITVLEAWASAKPVLMTRECNLPEGFAVGAALQIGTAPEEIAAGLKQLIEMSDDDRRAVGDRGRTLVATKFSWPRIGEQMRSVYEWILGGGTTPESVRL